MLLPTVTAEHEVSRFSVSIHCEDFPTWIRNIMVTEFSKLRGKLAQAVLLLFDITRLTSLSLFML